LRKDIGKYFELKEKSVGPPKLFLEGPLSLVELDNEVKAWAFSSSQHVRAVVQNVEDFIAKDETKRCVFGILAWMCSLWRLLVLEVDVNLYGLTISVCRVDGRSVT
jgi:hypothetical protein